MDIKKYIFSELKDLHEYCPIFVRSKLFRRWYLSIDATNIIRFEYNLWNS